MASRFPAPWLDDLRSRSDIVQVISGYVELKKSGRKYWGLCPFHGEKTASFSVDAEQQLFYCFGCKTGGNVITFIMEIERCSYHEAVELLADRAHIPMPEMVNDDDWERRRTRRERLLGANREAAKFYHEMLFRPEGAASLAYLRKRGLSDSVIRKFGLGAAPDQWTALTDHLISSGYTLDELSSVGLTILKPPDEKGGKQRYFDMFRNRAIFPIIDMYKNVIAFGGRSLGKELPKYMNSSDTPVFNKRKGVYAANLLRQQRHLDHVILVEGYMDVVSLTQFGVDGVCATLGTSLTNEQARLLRRFAPEVYLGYDGDSAGQHAILRGLDILEAEGIPAKVLDFPDGLDPDEFIRRDGAEGFAKLPALPAAAYRLRRLKESFDLSQDEGKMNYVRKAAFVLAPLDPVGQETYIKTLMLETGFPYDALRKQIDSVSKKDDNPSSGPSGDLQEKHTPRPSPRRSEPTVSPEETAQEILLGLLATGQIPKDMVEEKDFEEDELKSLYVALVSGSSPASLLDLAPDDETRSRYSRILMSPVAESTDQMISMATQCLGRIRKASCQKQYAALMHQIQSMDPKDPAVPSLLRDAQEIQRKLDRMN
ncbi:MAG: DNA primase [Clostridia bacterium]|nr:DNA primase [Clostridia bacterium]